MSGLNERVHLLIRGRVQGVWYRASACERARELGLRGWVRNRSDGQVELEAEGPRETLEALMAWCQKGPPMARVDRVEAEWGSAEGAYSSFEVR
jgi:acylphosphatase